ncbi:hypothetical protein KA005_04050 [bacterium]|nr:hypothetical protein [bacterium]
MIYKVDGWNNFCRVFELPSEYPKGFCFDGGKPTIFKMIDWFNPVSGLGTPACSKEVWQKEVGEIEAKEVNIDTLSGELIPWLKEKQYVVKGMKYLVICDFGATFSFDC